MLYSSNQKVPHKITGSEAKIDDPITWAYVVNTLPSRDPSPLASVIKFPIPKKTVEVKEANSDDNINDIEIGIKIQNIVKLKAFILTIPLLSLS